MVKGQTIKYKTTSVSDNVCKRNNSDFTKISYSTFAALFIATLLSATIFTNTTTSANKSVKASVNVSASCTLSSTVDNTHTTEASLGNWNDNIGQTTMTIKCNDPNGYALYAIGYSNNEWHNTDLIHTNPNDNTNISSYNIATNNYDETSTNNSYWSMKLYTNDLSNPATINAPYNNYSAIPNNYTKVASLDSTTSGNSISSLKLTYGAYITKTQPEGNYTGKVKYTLVHPHSATDENKPLSKDPTLADITNMQDTFSCADTAVGTTKVLTDTRDGNTYTVAKLADGNCWMTQNLDLDIDSNTTYTSEDTDIDEDWTPSTSTYAASDSGWNYSTTEPESYDPGQLCWNDTVDTSYNGTVDTYTVACSNTAEGDGEPGTLHRHIGNYYNWSAAVAMNDPSSYTDDQTDVDQSICPAGWRLPVYDGSKSYNTLVSSLGLTAGTGGNIQNSPAYFVYGGGWGGSSYDVGSLGFYWSSVVSGVYGAYYLRFDVDGALAPQDGGYRGGGYSVRCVAR